MISEQLRGCLVEALSLPMSQILQLKKSHQLGPVGQELLREVLGDVLLGKKFELSTQIGLLDGFRHNAMGIEELGKKLKQQNQRTYLAIINHYSECPLGIVGNAILTAYYLRTGLDLCSGGVEPWVVQGSGLALVALLRSRVGKVTNVLLAGSSGGGDAIGHLWRNGKPVILYPEGKNSHQGKKMIQGDFRAGRVMLRAVNLGIPIITAGIYFKNQSFALVAGDVLNPNAILELNSLSPVKKITGQEIVDYGMRSVARCLPENIRGYYY